MLIIIGTNEEVDREKEEDDGGDVGEVEVGHLRLPEEMGQAEGEGENLQEVEGDQGEAGGETLQEVEVEALEEMTVMDMLPIPFLHTLLLLVSKQGGRKKQKHESI